MRITLVISAVTAGGAERVMSDMANYWVTHEQEITLVTIWPAVLDWYRLDPRVNRVAISGNLISPSGHIGEALRSNLQRMLRLRQEIKNSRPDLVISFGDTTNVLTLIASRGAGIPIIVSERIDPRQHPIGLFWRSLRALLYRYANAVVVQSDAVREWASRLIGRRAIYVIPNPARPQDMTLSDLVPHQGPGRIAVAMGRLVHQKGFDLLIKAFSHCAAKHADWSLVILGEGPERQNLEAMAADLGMADRVKLVGQVREPAAILRQAEIFVMSSRYEGFPNALVEAMACGLAVISTDCPSGPRDIIRDGVDGVLVQPEDVDSLVSAISDLMTDQAKRQRLGKRATEVVERFSIGKVMKMWDELLLRVLRGSMMGGPSIQQAENRPMEKFL